MLDEAGEMGSDGFDDQFDDLLDATMAESSPGQQAARTTRSVTRADVLFVRLGNTWLGGSLAVV